ncbi:MAG TPA: D-2-hydroxyacid dehydrogenase [Polyangiaceae bacterium]|nr:D-2-hydroxyacid dehydrogenase [Polyangiaceae bacterium]
MYHPVFAEPIAAHLRPRLERVRVSAVTQTDVDPPDRDAIDALVAYRFPAGLLGRMRRLRWLQLTSVGFDHLAGEPRPAGLVVTHAGSVPCRAVAEFVMMGVFALARNAPALVRQHDGRVWARPGARLVSGSTLLVIGLGRIGSEVARAARANGLRVVAVTRSGAARDEADRCVTPGELPAVAPSADYVAVCVPGTPATRGLVGAAFFERLKPGAAFIDVSRGGVTDGAALAGALRSGRCRGALVDVHEREPLPPEHPLWGEPGAWVTPHCAFEQEREAEALGDLIAGNVRRLLASAALENVAELAAVPPRTGPAPAVAERG